MPRDHQTELMTFARPLTLRRHLYERSKVKADVKGRKRILKKEEDYSTGLDLNWLRGIRISLVMAGGALPRLVPELILTEDQIIY